MLGKYSIHVTSLYSLKKDLTGAKNLREYIVTMVSWIIMLYSGNKITDDREGH